MQLGKTFRFCLVVTILLGHAHTYADTNSLASTVMCVRFDEPISRNSFQEYRPTEMTGKRQLTVTIDVSREFHVIEGVGGAFNEMGGETLTHLKKSDKEAVLTGLFDLKDGAGFSFCRLPVGASDFALSAYSLNDHAGDYAMEHFSVVRDEKFLIPYIKGALTINPKLRLHACPWSPPGWLKNTGIMEGGGQLRDAPEVYRAYATYLRRFLEAYAGHGIRIDRLFVQNEPNIEIVFPSCSMPPKQMVKFVVDYLQPEFSAHRIFTEIWAGTFQETRQTLLAHECFADKRVAAAVRGVGFQYSDPVVVKDLQIRHPWLNVMHTEARCQNGDNTVAQAKNLFEEIVNHFDARCTVFTYWNMVLNEQQTSSWDWRQNSLITIDRKKRQVRYNPDYAVMGLISRYVRPGARWLLSSCDPGRPVVSFRDVDGAIVTLVWSDIETSCNVIVEDQRTQVSLPANALCVIVTQQELLDRDNAE